MSKDDKPEYLQAKDRILDLIDKEGLQIGDALPSVVKLTSKLKLGQISIQKAVKILSEDGILENIPRKGCFIKNPVSHLKKRDLDEAFEEDDFLGGPGFVTRKKHLRFAVHVGEWREFGTVWQDALLAFMKHNSDIDVEFITFRSLLEIIDPQKPLQADILHIPAYYLPYFVENNLLHDIQETAGFKLEAGEFFSGLHEASLYKNKCWGTPLVSAIRCQFYQKKNEKKVDAQLPQKDFWKGMGALKKLGHELKENDRAALVLANHVLDLMLAAKTSENPLKNLPKLFGEKSTVQFIKQFAEIFCDGKVFLKGDNYYNATSSIERYTEGKAMIITGDTSWLTGNIEAYQKLEKAQSRISPNIFGSNSPVPANTVLSAVSRSCPYPYDAAEVLSFLAREEIQALFAKTGKIVAHRGASQALKLRGFDTKSHQNLLDSAEKAKVMQTRDLNYIKYLYTVLNPETRALQNDRIDVDTYIDKVRNATAHYFASLAIQGSTLPG